MEAAISDLSAPFLTLAKDAVDAWPPHILYGDVAYYGLDSMQLESPAGLKCLC